MKLTIKKEWKAAFIAAIVIGLLTHMPIMLSDIPNHDGLASMYFNQNMITSGRWFLTIACGFSSYYTLPWLIGILAIVFLALTSVMLVEVLEIEKPSVAAVVAGILVTFPTLAATFSYVFTMDGYMLAVMLAVLAVLCVKKYRMGFIWGAIALAFSMGTYQSYLPICVILCIYSAVQIMLTDKTIKEKVKAILNYLYMGVIGISLYYIVLQILLRVEGKNLADYQGINEMTSLSLGMIKQTYVDFLRFTLSGDVLFHNLFSVLAVALIAIALVGTIIWQCVDRKLWKSPWFYIVIFIIIAVLPIICNVILIISPQVQYHTLMRYQWAFLLMMCIAFIAKFGNEIHLSDKWKLSAGAVLVALAGILVFNYAIVDNIAYSNLEKKYEKTYAYCLRLADRMEQVEGYYQGIPVGIIGVLSDKEYPATDITGDVTSNLIGISGDTLLYTGENYKQFFQNYLGITIELASSEEIDEMYNSVVYQKMGSFPAEDSMQIVDGILYIKTENVSGDMWEMLGITEDIVVQE